MNNRTLNLLKFITIDYSFYVKKFDTRFDKFPVFNLRFIFVFENDRNFETFFFLQNVWIFAFSALRLSSTDLNKKTEIMNFVLNFFFKSSQNKILAKRWSIVFWNEQFLFFILLFILHFRQSLWKEFENSFQFFFSFVKFVIWNDDEMMMFLILIIFYDFHLKKMIKM